MRECAHVVATEKGTYEFDICPEDGLSAQQYQCAECKAPLPLTVPKRISCIGRVIFQDNSWGDEPRLCDYTGQYYCMACHWGGRAVVPARVVHNWDLQPRPVCQAALQQLRITAQRPIINLEKINARLFSMVQELGLMKRLRSELIGMKKYLTVCRKATQDHVLWKHVDTPHLIDTLDMYSLQDLVDTNSGELPSKLHTLVDIFSTHIKVDCEICKGRAHICVICLSNEVVYPFDAMAHNCSSCNSVMHKVCYTRKNQCPKCLRIKSRMDEEKNNNQQDVDDKSAE
nr:unnamed protein product [Callosobruchus analis]